MKDKDLRDAGLRVTLPRQRILEILERGPSRHMSAEDIYRALLESHEDVGVATVYRVLTQFEAAGLVTRHHFESGNAVFELNGKMRGPVRGWRLMMANASWPVVSSNGTT